MSIWADANGWPVPPAMLLGCLAAEILYFRGWFMLIRGEERKALLYKSMKLTPMQQCPAFTSVKTGNYQRKRWLQRGIFFLCAIFFFLVAVSIPIDTLAGRIFWVHMIQHLLLLVVVPPLLLLSAPLIPLWIGLPKQVRKLIRTYGLGRLLYRIGCWLRQPAISCGLLIVGIWIWHWPLLYDLALTSSSIHDWCEHATFLAVSILFWTQVIPSSPLQPRTSYAGRIGCVGIAIVQNVVLAVLIGFAPAPLYAPYAHLSVMSGELSALQDQQIGAGIMWTFGDLPFGIAFSILVHRWLVSQSDDTLIAA
jgi:cytochrome c oxidase assembly factor CtaG